MKGFCFQLRLCLYLCSSQITKVGEIHFTYIFFVLKALSYTIQITVLFSTLFESLSRGIASREILLPPFRIRNRFVKQWHDGIMKEPECSVTIIGKFNNFSPNVLNYQVKFTIERHCLYYF